jgi:hypothetical protein
MLFLYYLFLTAIHLNWIVCTKCVKKELRGLAGRWETSAYRRCEFLVTSNFQPNLFTPAAATAQGILQLDALNRS